MEIRDPYTESIKREQDLNFNLRKYEIDLRHDRRGQMIRGTMYSVFSACGLGALVALCLLTDSCWEKGQKNRMIKQQLIDQCIREGTSPSSCACSFDYSPSKCSGGEW